jgi:hypothetical protein
MLRRQHTKNIGCHLSDSALCDSLSFGKLPIEADHQAASAFAGLPRALDRRDVVRPAAVPL